MLLRRKSKKADDLNPETSLVVIVTPPISAGFITK
jgi:hypothetical protein